MNEHKLINLTPHIITILLDNDERIVLNPLGVTARLQYDTESERPLYVDGAYVPLTRNVDPIIANLPEPEDGNVYIVPLVVAMHAKRADVVSPDRLIRNADGKPLGCAGLLVHD